VHFLFFKKIKFKVDVPIGNTMRLRVKSLLPLTAPFIPLARGCGLHQTSFSYILVLRTQATL